MDFFSISKKGYGFGRIYDFVVGLLDIFSYILENSPDPKIIGIFGRI